MSTTDRTGGTPRIAVPEHLLPKLRREAAFALALAGHELDDNIGDLDDPEAWVQFQRHEAALRERLRMLDEV